MTRRKPDRRVVLIRSSNNDKRRLRDPLPNLVWLSSLADRAGFEGYNKHKLAPQAFGLPLFMGARHDGTYCDGHAQFTPADMVRVPVLLRRGILAGLVGGNESHGDPTYLWTVDDNGWIYEARITIPGRAIYHGYPVLQNEAIASAVKVRYIQYVYSQATNLIPSAQLLQERYS